MTTPTPQNEIAAIHAAYCEATGFQIRLGYDRERAWADFLRDGFTTEDLLLVIAWIKREIKAERRREASLLFRNLVVHLDRFEEDCCCAKAHARKPVPTARDRALRELRPIVSGPVNGAVAQHGRDVALKALANLRKQIAAN